jgi:hypothetical protein
MVKDFARGLKWTFSWTGRRGLRMIDNFEEKIIY